MRLWGNLLVSLILLSGCAADSTLPFREGFEDNRNEWMLLKGSQAEIDLSGGRLLITVKQPDALAWSVAAGRMFDNFTLDVDATPVAGPEDNDYGVIVRHVDDYNFYRFEISSDGYYNVQKRHKSKWEKLIPDWGKSDAIRKGLVTNHLRVVCAGRTMTFYINQVEVVQVTDDAFARGRVGVFAGALSTPGVQVAFDNLQVSR